MVVVMGLGWASGTGSQCPRSQLLAQARSDGGEMVEWMPEVWAVFLDSDFGFSSDVLTLPSLQPKLPVTQGKGCVLRSSGGMANGEAAPSRPASFRKRSLLHPSWGNLYLESEHPGM